MHRAGYLTALVLVITVALPMVTGAALPATRRVSVLLNGRKLADGAVIPAAGGEEVFIPVSALARAVDGDHAARPRVRVESERLLAIETGACDSCIVRVMRAVVVSQRVRAIEGNQSFPLADLVTAFEGRLEVDGARNTYGIYAGKCTWCILAPR